MGAAATKGFRRPKAAMRQCDVERNGADNCISVFMMIWPVLIAMTLAVMAALLVSVYGRRGEVRESAEHDRAVFRDQLNELERDKARGVIGAVEAEAARNEISRRLLRAVPGGLPRASTPWVAALSVLMIPAVALPLYLQRGNPKLPDVPLAARLDGAIENQDFDAMIAKVERHLAGSPDDVQGWTVLAPAYRRLQRWNDAASAFANIMRLGKATPETIASYGEMLVFANEGMVSAEASRAFSEALKLDPKLPKARYFHAVALKQEGKREEARAVFEHLLADSPADAPWRAAVETELMIAGMVDGLEARLKTDGNDLEGWQRLIRSRTVLGEMDKAKGALAEARERFKDRADAIAALAALAKEVGIE